MKNSKDVSQQRFTKFAAGYVTSSSHAKGSDLERLVEIAQPQADWLVLDIATGGGHTALRFAPHVHHVIATDITPKMLASAEAFIRAAGVENVSFELVDAEAIPYEDNRFDLVTCRIAPHHFPDVAAFVRHAARVLKPGGMLLVQDHVISDDPEVAAVAEGFERLRDPGHHRAFSREEWISMFEQAGLEVTHTEEITKRHAFEEWAQRQGCTDETVHQLREMVEHATESVQDWMKPHNWQTSEASFINHHIIIAGSKGSL